MSGVNRMLVRWIADSTNTAKQPALAATAIAGARQFQLDRSRYFAMMGASTIAMPAASANSAKCGAIAASGGAGSVAVRPNIAEIISTACPQFAARNRTQPTVTIASVSA